MQDKEKVKQVASFASKGRIAIASIITVSCLAVIGYAGMRPVAAKGKPESACPSCTSTLITGDEPTITKLMAGVTYQFRIDPQSTVPTGGTWSAQYGTVDAQGNYTAPTYQPPWGQDKLTYHAPDGIEESNLTILVAANPDLPDSGYPRYIRVPGNWDDHNNIEGNPQAQLISGADGSVVETGDLGSLAEEWPKLPTLDADDEVAGPPVTSDCTDLVADTTVPVGQEQMSAATVVAQDVVGSVSDALVVVLPANQPVQKKPKKCVIWPVNPLPIWNHDPCPGPPSASREVESKPVTTGPVKIPPLQSGSMEFSAEVNVSLGMKGYGDLGVGYKIGASYPMTRQILEWKQTIKKDIYKCKNGVWTFVGTKTCTRSGNGEWAYPKWVAVIDGYNPNGYPNEWTPWSCD